MSLFQKLFGKKEPSVSAERFPDGIDYHCHILPGVDDGFQETEKSLEMLRLYEKVGMKEVWLTPHIMEDVPNERLDCQARNVASPLKLHLAAENMLDALFEKRLRQNDLLPLADKYLLVETSIFGAPMNFRGLLERIKNKGYTPILAHPERYLYMEKSDYEQLKAQGIKFQRNLFSIEGQYGEKVKKRCQKLLKWGMYDFLGSDLHRIGVFQRYW